MCTWLQKHGLGDRRARLTPRNLSSIIWAFGSFGYAPSRMPFLLDLAEQYGTPARGGIAITLPFSQEEIAASILWALSDEASFVTATTIRVAGGA